MATPSKLTVRPGARGSEGAPPPAPAIIDTGRTGRARAISAAALKIQRKKRLGKTAASPVAFVTDPSTVFRLAPSERIRIFKEGVPAIHVEVLSARMRTSKESLIDTLRLSRATVHRKARAQESLSQDESERVLGMEALIGQVQIMIDESGDGTPFDAAAWVASWLQRPVPALGGRRPAEYMDSIEGQKMVSGILAMAQSGAYA